MNAVRQLSFLSAGQREEAPTRQHVGELAFAEVTKFPPPDEIGDGDFFSFRLSNDTTMLTHGLHRFPAKFIPQVPAWALAHLAEPGSTVVDPFAGSGTTLVESLRFDLRCTGLDIDPLARLIAGAKTDPAPADDIARVGARVLDAARDASPCRLTVPMKGVERFDHWFTHDAWRKLQALREAITTDRCDERTRRVLMVVFSSILRWVSNADDQSMKTYVSGTNRKRPAEVLEAYARNLARAIRGVRELEVARSPHAVAMVAQEGDATRFGVVDESVDLIVTSPPYLDSVDYAYNFMLEYFWLGDLLGVPDRATFNVLRRSPIGSKLPISNARLPAALAGAVDVDAMTPARGRAAQKYFADMDAHFAEARRALRRGGRYALVIGNSQTRANILPVHDCLLRLAAARGLVMEKAFAYRVRRHYMKFPRNGRGGIILIDWIIVMRKVAAPVSAPRPLPLPWATLGRRAVAN